MLNKINDKKKIINLKNILEEFLDEYDCKDIKCEDCDHKRVCGYMYRLYATLRIRYLKDNAQSK